MAAAPKFNAIVAAQNIVDFFADDNKTLFLSCEPILGYVLAMARQTIGQPIKPSEQSNLEVKGYLNGTNRTKKGDWLLKTFGNLEMRFELWVKKTRLDLDEGSAKFVQTMAEQYTGTDPYTADDRQDDMEMINSLIRQGFLNERSTGYTGHLRAIWITDLGRAWASNI